MAIYKPNIPPNPTVHKAGNRSYNETMFLTSTPLPSEPPTHIKKGGHKRKKWMRITIVLLVITALSIWALYAGLTVRDYPIKSDKITFGSVRIIEIADLHSHIYGGDQKPLIDLVKAQRPDIIALVGDILDDEESDTGAWLFLDGIKDIAPIYYVSGNHEYWSDKYDDIKEKIESYGITVLENEWKEIDINGVHLRICGVEDPMMFEYTNDPEWMSSGNEKADEERLFRKCFSNLDDSAYNVLLAHRPEYIETYLKYRFDLILSGHTHGGQIRIPPLINGLFAPSQGIFPKYAGGRYDFDDGKTLIVSRGLSFNTFIPRVFNPPEVVVADISGQN